MENPSKNLTLEEYRKIKQTILFLQHSYDNMLQAIETNQEKLFKHYENEYRKYRNELHDLELQMYGGSVVTYADKEKKPWGYYPNDAI